MSNNRHDRGAKTAGVSMGGKFAASTRTESDGSVLGGGLSAPERDWGELDLEEGSHTPWGSADHVERPAPGIVIVSTESHGGVKLSSERNREVPTPLRNRDGWYEEDCEAYIPAAIFAEHFPNRGYQLNDKLDPEEVTALSRAQAERGVQEWFPDQWEQATGEKVTAEQSRVVAEREWRAAHAGMPIVNGANASDSDPTLVRVSTIIESSKDEADYLVPRAEYEKRSRLGFAVDPERHPRLLPREPQSHDLKKPQAKTYSFADQRQHVAQDSRKAAAIDKDLGQRWRHPETGLARTLEDIIEQEGAVELQTYFGESGRPTFALIGRNSSSYRVSKTTAEFLATQIPDGTSGSAKLHAKADRAYARYQKLNSEAYSLEERKTAHKAFKLSQAIKQEAAALAAQEREAFAAANGTWEERAEREKQVQIGRERAAIAAHRNGVTA